MDSFTTPEILREVEHERDRQEEKWGQQDHPSVHPFAWYDLASEGDAKNACEAANKARQLSWADIAIEELSEAVFAEDDDARREELVQLAAVAVAWIECIDRRKFNASL
jgi:hypothetical protein